ncbi:unknown [Clostridium sp. CAG:492]|nr:unknown [Clostridium sp. CAG:492]
MLISSKIEKLKYKFNKYIKKDNKNNLKTDSIVKTDVIYKIFTKNILLKIGNIDKTKVDIYKNYLINNN